LVLVKGWAFVTLLCWQYDTGDEFHANHSPPKRQPWMKTTQ